MTDFQTHKKCTKIQSDKNNFTEIGVRGQSFRHRGHMINLPPFFSLRILLSLCLAVAIPFFGFFTVAEKKKKKKNYNK